MADCGDLLRGVFWFLILVLVSFFIAGFCFFFYLLFGVLEACIPDLKGLTDLLMRGMQFPALCSKNMVKMAPYDAI